jgi:Protein of unknown function (DUF1573)
MLKKPCLFLFLALTLGFSACSDSNSKAQNDKAVQTSQEAKPQADPNTVNAQGTVATIQPPPQSAQPNPQVAIAPVQSPQPAPAVAPDKAPKMVLPVKKADYGTQPKEKTIFRSFTIKNAGKSVLNIESVTPSCSCTTVDFPKTVKPGQSGVIKFKVDTGAAPGIREKSITVKTNDPNEPTASFEFSFMVKDK